MSILQRSSSTPTIIKLPGNQGQLATQPTIAAGAAGNTPGRTKIITVKRVGANGSITQSRSFTISADGASGFSGGQKIIVQRGNGGTGQVMQAGSQGQVLQAGSHVPTPAQAAGSHATGTIKVPISVVQSAAQRTQQQNVIVTTIGNTSAFVNQFKQFTQTYTTSSDTKVNLSVQNPPFTSSLAQNSVRTQPHVIHINRPLATTSNQIVNRTLPQTARLVSTQSVMTAGSPSIRVIQRPFQNSPSTSPGLNHSQSVPGNLTSYSNISNIPHHMFDQRDSPPSVIVNQSGFGGNSKLVLNNLYEKEMSSMDPMSAMHRSVQSIPAPKITNRDVSRMWSNQDIRLKNITHSVVSIYEYQVIYMSCSM